MKIGVPGISPEATAGRAPAAADGALAELKWRRALEQAQWELTGHDRPALEKAGAAHRAAPAVNQPMTAPVSRAGVPAPAADDRPMLAPAPRPDVASIQAEAARLPDAQAPGSRPVVAQTASTGASLHAATALDGEGLEALVERCVQACTRFAETKWTPVSAHVRIDGNLIGVTLRDARIGAREAQEILHRLRGQLASLGLGLQELTINGHLITPEASDESAS